MLLVQKALNDLIEEYNLPQLYIAGSDHKPMSLTTECGKPLYFFTGTRIPNKLTQKERDVLVEVYLTPVLLAKRETLIKLLNEVSDSQYTDKEEALYKENLASGYSLSHTRESVSITVPLPSMEGVKLNTTLSRKNGVFSLRKRSMVEISYGSLRVLLDNEETYNKIVDECEQAREGIDNQIARIKALRDELNPPCNI